MSTSLYDLTVPALVRGLAAMNGILEKGRAHAEAHALSPDSLLRARLYEDMGDLIYQVQRASDTAKGAVARLGQLPPLSLADEETTFEDVQARIAATIAYLEQAPREAFEGREEAEVVLPTPRGDIPFTGRSYALGFALPNFYFHLTTAYAILRHKGVPLGKLDYLGSR